MPTTDETTEPTMNERLRLKPPPHDIFAKYHVEDTEQDTEQDTENTEPKDAA